MTILKRAEEMREREDSKIRKERNLAEMRSREASRIRVIKKV